MCFCQQKGTEKEELSVEKLVACKTVPIPNFDGDIGQVYMLSYRKRAATSYNLFRHIGTKLVEN